MSSGAARCAEALRACACREGGRLAKSTVSNFLLGLAKGRLRKPYIELILRGPPLLRPQAFSSSTDIVLH